MDEIKVYSLLVDINVCHLNFQYAIFLQLWDIFLVESEGYLGTRC